MSKLDKYKKVISKDDLNSLDLGRYLGEIVLVDTKHDLNKACEEIKKCSIIGIDTETKPSFKKGIVCLLYKSPSPRDAHESRMPSSA